MSDDGTEGLTIIAFIGSVFSPYYALARRRGDADPTNHVAINVALYGSRGGRWSMTERGRGALATASDRIAVGPSSIAWDGSSLCISFDEMAVPVPRRMRGRVRVWPTAMAAAEFELNANGAHVWRPIAPHARVEVECDAPSLRWSGTGYVDHNRGEDPLEDGFREWNWSRTGVWNDAIVFYDGQHRNGAPFALAMRFDKAGRAVPLAIPPATDLPLTRWRMRRRARSESGSSPRLLQTLEDAPFYTRSAVVTRIDGSDRHGIHETLSLDRFRMPIVQAMLPFRMPRRA